MDRENVSIRLFFKDAERITLDLPAVGRRQLAELDLAEGKNRQLKIVYRYTWL